MNKWVWIVGGIVALAIIASASSGGSSDQQSDAPAAEAAEERPARDGNDDREQPKSKYEQVKASLREHFGDQLASVDRNSGAVNVRLHTQDNLTNGMIKSGMDLDAQAVFETVYADARYPAKLVQILFDMPLVNSETGEEFVGKVASYFLARGQAKRINWDNADIVEWDTYRTMVHPVLQ